MRQSKKGEWRTNVSKGGRARQIEVDPKLKKMALKSAQVLGLDLCAVDFIETEKGFVVVEVNFTPGGIIKIFGNKIIKKFVRALHAKGSEAKHVW
jgi:ribosomal protein S6--L-glutamate ligase